MVPVTRRFSHIRQTSSVRPSAAAGSRWLAAAAAVCALLPLAANAAQDSPVDPANPALMAGLAGGGGGGKCNVPTDGIRSPLFGAEPFTQHLFREEMFGTMPMASDADYAKAQVAGYDRTIYGPELENASGSCTACGNPAGCGDALCAYKSVAGKYIDEYLDPDYEFMAQDGTLSTFGGLWPRPQKSTDMARPNPWQSVIEDYHTGPLTPMGDNTLSSFADGRPPGDPYAHQRWEEFYPQRYFTSSQAGSRENGGLRDRMQFHMYGRNGYASEFAPGGLYHNTVHGKDGFEQCREIDESTFTTSGEKQVACEAAVNPQTSDGSFKEYVCAYETASNTCRGKFDGTTNGIVIKFHPRMPEQDPQALWTFDGTLPPKLLQGRYGEGLLFRHYNALPIKFEANRGFGNHFISTHRHNGHQPAESDGYAEAFFLPGQYWDYRWPMVMAGHDSINTDRQDPRASMPCVPGEMVRVTEPSVNPEYPAPYWDPMKGQGQVEVVTCPMETTPDGKQVAGLVNLPGDYREIMSTHWFHDHMLDFTAQNVYKGNAAMFNMYSGIDRANECLDDGVNLRFPSGCPLATPQKPAVSGSKADWDTCDAAKSGPMDPDVPHPPVGQCKYSQDEGYSWGNRDYDVNLIVATKAWGQDTARYEGTTVDDTRGQLWFSTFNNDGFVGDVVTANLLYNPYQNVRARRYRYRILAGDVSRFFRIAIVAKRNDSEGKFPGEEPNTSYDPAPFHLIANDGNVMEHSVPFDGSMDLDGDGQLEDHNGILPTQSIAERFDIVIDFSRYAPGTKLYMVNLLEHRNGKRPHEAIPLAEVLAGAYEDCDRAVGKFMEMRVVSCTTPGPDPANPYLGGEPISCHDEKALGYDQSMDPSEYVPGKKTMLPMPYISPEELLQARHRTFKFGRGAVTDANPVNNPLAEGGMTDGPVPSDPAKGLGEFLAELGHSVNETEHEQLPLHVDKPWGIKTDDQEMLGANMRWVSAAPTLGDLEVWHIQNGGGGWSHNVHVHFEEGRILTRDGKPPPEWEKWARKDVYRVGRMDDSGDEVTFAIRFREFAGSYMEHCHNTVHEDNAMLLRWDIENAGQLKPFLTPEPQWNGCGYADSGALPTARALDEYGFTRAEGEVGNPDAKLEFFQSYTVGDALCPPGATSECPGAETAGLEAPAPLGGDASLAAESPAGSGSSSVGQAASAPVSATGGSFASESVSSVVSGGSGDEEPEMIKRSKGKKKKNKGKGRRGRRAGRIYR